ncbi:MAG: enoyl-CoA hydratase [Microbacterium sp.]
MTESPVLYAVADGIATITLNRPNYRNAQNSAMTYAIDDALSRAVDDDEVRVIVLAGAGDHFSAGHDIGTPERDVDVEFPRRAAMLPTHVRKEGIDQRWTRESEVYLGMSRRWREAPKPTVAAVQGACIAGGLMLAWSCDLIVAADDAFFTDPVVKMGIPGVEFFAHPWVMGPRMAKEFLFTARRVGAEEAGRRGWVNRVVPRAELESSTRALAAEIAEMPPFGLMLAKRAVNLAEDMMGQRLGMDATFALHHLGHARGAELGLGSLGGVSTKDIAGKPSAGA